MHVTSPYAAAVILAIVAALLLVLVVFLARKIRRLEGALRDRPLADPLTGLHSRSGFYLLGEQVLLDARRAAGPLTVFCFGVDGLQKINDAHGKDVAAEALRDIATILRVTFRRSDVLGRLAGGEFAVITRGRQAELTPALRRLDDTTGLANDAGSKPYRIRLSVRAATAEPHDEEPFAELLARAQAAVPLQPMPPRGAAQ